MPTLPPEPQPSRDELMTEIDALRREVTALRREVTALRQEVTALRQERDDLQMILEMTTDHADHLSETLQEERDDLKIMLDVTTEHSDEVEEELLSETEALETRNQFIRETFGRYVSDDVVTQLLDAQQGVKLSGEKRKATILMSDVRGFTARAERLDPQEVLSFLNRYLEAMVTIILDYQGTIIEILGDGLLVIFGAPIQRPNDAERAVACAIAMQLQVADTNTINRRNGLPEVEMGIGLHTGNVVVGNIGSYQRTKYGAVGSTVNLAARVESYTTGGQVLISTATFNEVAPLLTITQQIDVEPKGVSEPITLFDVCGIGGQYRLFLPDQTEVLTLLHEAIPIRYTVLEEKFAGRTIFAGRLVKLANKMAELHTDQPPPALSNLKLQIIQTHDSVLLDDVFAKVVSLQTDHVSCVLIHFTSLTEEARTFLAQRRLSV